MKINRIEEVMGVQLQADMVEGRFGLLCKNNVAVADYGSSADFRLPGIRVPISADEAEQARFCVTWAVDNRKPPYLVTMPNFEPAFRYGWDKSTQFPASVTYYNTYPGYQDSMTIPSGTPVLAYGVGTYTIPSGQYIANANLHNPGAFVIIANTAEDTTDAGKPKYQATNDARVIGVVEHWDSATGDLTIRVK